MQKCFIDKWKVALRMARLSIQRDCCNFYDNDESHFAKGGNIDGKTAGNKSGWSVSISDDGKIFRVGDLSNDANGSNTSHVWYIYNTTKRFRGFC